MKSNWKEPSHESSDCPHPDALLGLYTVQWRHSHPSQLARGLFSWSWRQLDPGVSSTSLEEHLLKHHASITTELIVHCLQDQDPALFHLQWKGLF